MVKDKPKIYFCHKYDRVHFSNIEINKKKSNTDRKESSPALSAHATSSARLLSPWHPLWPAHTMPPAQTFVQNQPHMNMELLVT